jgi:hypothetical protein
MHNKLFISTPLSAFDDETEYLKFKTWLNELATKIRISNKINYQFCAALKIKDLNSFEDPIDSIREDIEVLRTCNKFLFIYPKEMATSALVELGIALELNKDILIVQFNGVKLPYMVNNLHLIYKCVKKIVINQLDTESLSEISRCLL